MFFGDTLPTRKKYKPDIAADVSNFDMATQTYTRTFSSDSINVRAARGVPQDAIDYASELVAELVISSRDRSVVNSMDDVTLDAYLVEVSPGMYETTVRATGSTSNSNWDTSISWRAYATIRHERGAIFGASGGWEQSDRQVSISNRRVTYHRDAARTVSSNTFNITQSQFISATVRPTVATSATLSRSTTTWNLSLTVSGPMGG